MTYKIAVVIPCFRVRAHIIGVLSAIGPEVSNIYVVDDKCPQKSGDYVREIISDSRVTVLYNDVNLGVGGAVIAGYKKALEDCADIIVKIDGDGQMDAGLIRSFCKPIHEGWADYTKGNRFYNMEDVRAMPSIRLFGNAILSFLTKLSTGYWSIFDPTNGLTAISAAIVGRLPLDKLSRRYFFESDMLFRLGAMRACVLDIPMTAVYADEVSNLKIGRVLPRFIFGHLRNLGKRLLYSYFIRDFSIASLELLFGSVFLIFGAVFGGMAWRESIVSGTYASTGTVMLAALPVLLGIQFLLSFLAYDIAAMPSRAIHPVLRAMNREPMVPAVKQAS